jgi:DNA-directed RNA polymerase subunit alpha
MAVKLGRFEMPNRLTKDEKTATDNYAKFIAEPFESGYAHTLGNALRRVLLSSLEGAGITAVKIDGVPHEFSTMDNVHEDVAEIILNLKGVLLVSNKREPRKLELKAKKKGPVTAADIKTDGVVEVLNPDHHLFTITKERAVRMEITVDIGRGYEPAEETKKEDQPIGVIVLDAVFNPVRKVKYYVESTRVGQQLNYDRLVLEVTTDGRLVPDEALKQASAVLREHLAIFVDYDESYIEFDEKEEAKEDEQQDLAKLLQMSINEIELSVRAANCIASANITTIGDLVSRSEAEMLKYRNFGKKSLNEIKAIIESMGLSLGMDVGDYMSDVESVAVEEEESSEE